MKRAATERGIQSSRPWAGKHLGPNDKVLGKTFSGYCLVRRANTLFVQSSFSRGSMLKVISVRELLSISALWGGENISLKFPRFQQGNISLDMPNQSSHLPHPRTLLQFLQRWKELSVFIQKAVTQIFSQERYLGLRPSQHQVAGSDHGLCEQFHQVHLSNTNI